MDFNDYSIGDLHNYDAAIANDNMSDNLFKELGLEGKYGASKQTIGSSVYKLFEALLK